MALVSFVFGQPDNITSGSSAGAVGPRNRRRDAALFGKRFETTPLHAWSPPSRKRRSVIPSNHSFLKFRIIAEERMDRAVACRGCNRTSARMRIVKTIENSRVLAQRHKILRRLPVVAKVLRFACLGLLTAARTATIPAII